MPHLTTRRLYGIFGKKAARYFMYMKAKRMCNEINRDISFFESRFLKSRLHGA